MKKSKTPHVDMISKKVGFWFAVVVGAFFPNSPVTIAAGIILGLAMYDDYKEQKRESEAHRED